MTPRQQRLAGALSAARSAALNAASGSDGGSANLDSPFLHARRGLKEETVLRAADAAGVSVRRYDSRWWNGWFLHLTTGQGAMRTRMAEAATKAMNDAGEEASVYYQLD